MTLPCRHSEFYHADGSVIFRVENTLYKLHPTLFEVSDTLSDMRSFDGLRGEGSSDAFPIVLDSHKSELDVNMEICVTTQNFDYFLRWFYGGYTSPNRPTVEALEAILVLSDFLQAQTGRTYVLTTLSELSSPIETLVLAQKYRIPDLINLDLFTSLLKEEMSPKTCSRLGIANIFLLIEVQRKIWAHRDQLAYTPPEALHAHHCRRTWRDECSAKWRNDWWNVFAKYLLNPHRPASPWAAFGELLTSSKVYGEESCRKLTLDSVIKDGLLRGQALIIEGAISQLKVSCC
ncbi:hypothetical protein K439DRAFT_756022 [Ramaria rubella]|nr:hypothetical protein K439DRAFT_756022 [Ramaria rubella]